MQKSINVFANEAQKAISVERYDSRPFIAPLKVGSSGARRRQPKTGSGGAALWPEILKLVLKFLAIFCPLSQQKSDSIR